MSKLGFWTRSILDEEFLFTMGMSVKEKSNPIGYFGTGLKYAVAVILRLGGTITICTPETKYHFGVEQRTVRGKSFGVIICRKEYRYAEGNDFPTQQMPMTTDYGKDWRPWMALRELYSNTIDEGGCVYDFTRDPKLRDDPLLQEPGTLIEVDCGDVYDAWRSRHDIWLLDKSNRAPVYESDALEVYLRPSNALFYQGIRVSQDGFKSALTYNIKRHINLTEDRTYSSWSFQWDFSGDIMKINVRDVARKILEATTNETVVESEFNLALLHNEDYASTAMQEEALRVYRLDPNQLGQTAREAMVKYQRHHSFDELYREVQLSDEEKAFANTANTMLSDYGFPLDKYRIRFCEDLENTLYGLADPNTNTIVINILLLRRKMLPELVKTMLEEFVHLEYGVIDCSREMQNRLFTIIFDLMNSGKLKEQNHLLDYLKRAKA